MPSFDQVWPVVAFIAGSLTTLGIETVRSRRERQIDAERHQRLREQARDDRREAFELQHLSDVYVALSALVKASAEAENARRTMAVHEQHGAAIESASRDVLRLRDLVLDEHLREIVKTAHGAVLVAGRQSASGREGDHAAASDAWAEARLQLTGRIRRIYAD